MAAAGELAIEAGILPWPAGHAAWAVRECFNAWLAARGQRGHPVHEKDRLMNKRRLPGMGLTAYYHVKA